MLEVHAILQRQRCNENITKKTGTLSDAYAATANKSYNKNLQILAIQFWKLEVVFTESCNKISGYTSKKLIHKNNRTYLEKNKSFFKYILLFLKKLKTILKYSIV